jgi:hypothetical protein
MTLQRPLIQTDNQNAVVASLTQWIEAQNYVAYDPFAGGLGAPIKLKDRLKLFAAPPLEGWSSLVIAADNPLEQSAMMVLSDLAPVVVFHIFADSPPDISVYRDHQFYQAPDGLVPLLKSDYSRDQLYAAWEAMGSADVTRSLDDDVAASGPVKWLVNRMTRRYVKEMEADGADIAAVKAAAQSALNQSADEIDFQRPDIRALQAITNCLNLPEDWGFPTWRMLNKAYSVARQRDYRANAITVPGDDDLLQAIPNALNYRPLFYARATETSERSTER